MIPMTWLLLRTTGVIALVLLTISVLSGIAGPVIRKPALRLSLISVHSAAAATGVILLVGHVVMAVADSYVNVSPLAVVLPGASDWQPVWVGLGAAAFDMLAIITITSMTRLRAPVVWRKFHLLAYPAWALAWGHALTAGTDASAKPMVALAIVSFVLVAVAGVARLSRPAVSRDNRGLTGPEDRPAAPQTVGSSR